MAPLGHGGRRLRGLLALPRARDRGAGPAGWLRLGSSLFDLSSKSRRVWASRNQSNQYSRTRAAKSNCFDGLNLTVPPSAVPQ
jgi:hypothetical protein